MKSKALTFGTAVRVFWEDSMTIEGWKYATQTLGQTGKIVSLGYVLNNKDDVLVLSTSIGSNGGGLSPLCIPWSCIQKIDKLGKDWDRV